MSDEEPAAQIIALGAATDIGLRRRRNEDSYRCVDDLGLWLVADGMGGPGGGALGIPRCGWVRRA